MNDVEKHIHNLNLTFNTFNNNKTNQNKTYYNIKNEKNNKKTKNIKNPNNNNDNNNFDNINLENDTILKRPYTAHGYKIKSKTKRLPKINKNKNIYDEEEKIIAFKEKVLVHDKILSLYNNFLIKKDNNDNNKFSKTHKPRISSAFNLTNNKNYSSKHYMKPREKDIKKTKKKVIIYYNDKPEEDLEEIKYKKEENEIKNKNDKVIKLIRESNKYYGKSKQVLSDLKDVLTKENMDTFMNNFLLKNNFDIQGEDSKINNKYYQYSSIEKTKMKFYHGGKIYNRPKSLYQRINIKKLKNNNNIIHNNSDNNLEKKEKYKLFNPKEIISNPNNKFNFFSQTFTKQPIYGKYYEPPNIESSINNNLSYIETNQWNGRYKIKKFINEEKENPNDVYNYDYKYDDLNSDSDNELPSTNFKARTMPKYNKINIEYKDKKTGKIIGGKNKYKMDYENEKYQDNGRLDKNIYHPFLIDENALKNT